MNTNTRTIIAAATSIGLDSAVTSQLVAEVRRLSRPANHRSTTTPEYFFHLRDVNLARPKGRTVSDVTAFIRPIGDQLYVAYVERDSRDAFSRREGRNRARAKWFDGKRAPISEPSYDAAFANHIAEAAVADTAPLFIG